MDDVHFLDLVKNINKKSKFYGKYAVAYSKGLRNSYFHYFTGQTVYTSNKSFGLVKRFSKGESFMGMKITTKQCWGIIRLENKNGAYYPSTEEVMEEMKKYLRCKVV